MGVIAPTFCMVNDAAFDDVQCIVVPIPYGAGFESKVTEHVAFPQLELGGFVAEQVPLHWIVPEFVCPQALAAEVHAVPYPAGLEGVVAEHVPLHWIVPLDV